MNLNYQFIVFIAILNQFCSASKGHISQSKLESACNVLLLIDREHIYQDFYQESDMNKNLKKDNERLHLEFYLMASTDANILLSVNTNYEGPHYEIVLGIERNSKSVLRSKRNGDVVIVAENKSPNMLSPFDPILVEIIQRNDGKIFINVPGYAEPLLTYLDKDPMKINFVGLATWNKHQAKWFYNCQFDENSNMEGQKNNEEQLATSKLLATDSNMKQLMEFCWSGVLNRHKSFFHGLVPILDKFDDNQVIEFQQGVIELMKKVKKTSTTEQPVIDVRFGN